MFPSSRRKPGPNRGIYPQTAVGEDLRGNCSLGLWVPAFAGTTEMICYFSSSTTLRTAGRSSMRLRCAITFGSADRSTPSPSSQVPSVNR